MVISLGLVKKKQCKNKFKNDYRKVIDNSTKNTPISGFRAELRDRTGIVCRVNIWPKIDN